MKKSFSLFLTLLLILSFSMTALADANDSKGLNFKQSDRFKEIQEIYDVPTEVLKTLDEDTLNAFITDVDPEDISSSTTYIKFSENKNGTVNTEKFTEAEYLKQKSLNADVANTSWMKVHLVIASLNSTTAEVSGAYTWLKRPAFRMKDVVGLVVQNGTVVADSANGFYSYTTSQGASSVNWTSGFKYFLGGATRVQNLAKPDYPVNSDYLFMRMRIYKNGNAEGLYGTYGHQRASISVSNPIFELTRTSGKLRPLNFTLGVTYDEATDYASKLW